MIRVLLGIVGDAVRRVVPRRTHTYDRKNPYMRDTYDGYQNGS